MEVNPLDSAQRKRFVKELNYTQTSEHLKQQPQLPLEINSAWDRDASVHG
ncbi:MAG TPA: hypothetical protein ACN46P_04630 [Prochlorococcus sp.]|nr:hypothetical protein [Prochlorococcaceae cyanobacterium ETNP2_MAG_10]